MRTTNNHEGGWIALVALVAIIALVIVVTVPNFLDAMHRGKRKRTMSDLRTIGSSIESYQVDHAHAPRVYGDHIEVEKLRPYIEGIYVNELPLRDDWGAPFRWSQKRGRDGYSIVSSGKDGRADAEVFTGATTSFSSDLYFSDGGFTVWPEGTMN